MKTWNRSGSNLHPSAPKIYLEIIILCVNSLLCEGRCAPGSNDPGGPGGPGGPGLPGRPS